MASKKTILPHCKVPSPELGIGERVRIRRKELGLSVEELSALTALYDSEADYVDGSGVSIPTLYRYEKGERLPGARELRLLCDALCVPPDWLLLGRKWAYSAEPKPFGATAAVIVKGRLQQLVDEISDLIAAEIAVGAIENEEWRAVEHGMKIGQVKERFRKQ